MLECGQGAGEAKGCKQVLIVAIPGQKAVFRLSALSDVDQAVCIVQVELGEDLCCADLF